MTEKQNKGDSFSWQHVNADALLSHISDVVGIMDVNGIIRYKSPNIETLFGWAPTELIGKPGWENVHPDDVDRAKAVFETLLKEDRGKVTIQLRYRSKDGTYSNIKLVATNLIQNPQIHGVLLNYHDIAEWDEAQQKLQRSEERFKALHNASFGGIAIHDKGMILDCNQGLAQISGYRFEELIGMNGLDLIAEQSREFVMGQILAGYDKPYEATGVRKNGEEYPLRLEGKNIPYRDTEVRVVEFRDITDTKTAELEIKKKNEELAKSLESIQRMNRELEEAKEKAEESDRLKTAFLSNLSHEIRTPMNGILGFAELLNTENLDTNDQKCYVSIIQQSGERMLSLIHDLIDISHIETGQVKISNKDVNLNQLFDRIYEFFKPIVLAKGLEYSVEKGLSDAQSVIITDPTRVEQILTNLIGNATKFTKSGRICFGYSVRNDLLHFWVKDTGRGIPLHMQSVIFERFRQVDDSALREEEGSGLGLAISKSLVELMGGKIGVVSELGKGSEFFFTLPWIQPATLVPSSVSSRRKSSRGALNILVAEDDEISFLFLKSILHRNDSIVMHARNGKEAVELYERHPETDIILMDIKMPLINGLEATRRIRALNSRVPIIAQTAYASDGERQSAREAGCNDTVAKPIKRELLLETIERSLEQ